MFTLSELLQKYGIDHKKVRLIRHGNKDFPILETFQEKVEKLTEYTSWQKPGRFGNAEYLVVFGPARGTTALFLGVWKILGVTENKNLKQEHKNSLKKYGFPEEIYDVRYDLELDSAMDELSLRLVIEWGRSTVSWVQSGDRDKKIVEIKPKNSIGDFTSYHEIFLSYRDLVRLTKDTDSNVSWVNALSAVNGVYLIKHKKDGRLYVGSAYGDQGSIFNRWANYARTGHGGNELLKNLDPNEFEFSILEIFSSTIPPKGVVERENLWKRRLGTWEFGLNRSEKH